MEIFLFITALVQRYKIRLPNQQTNAINEETMEEMLGLTLQPKRTVRLQFINRTNV